MRIVAFDVETTGIPLFEIPSDDPRQPHITQLAAVMYDDGKEVGRMDMLVKPDGWKLPEEIERFNQEHNTGITQERLEAEGLPIAEVVDEFMTFIASAERIVAHNVSFDRRMLRIELKRLGQPEQADEWKADERFFCTMKESTNITKLDFKKPKKNAYKQPKLEELYRHCFGADMDGAHNALHDTLNAMKCYLHLFSHNPAATVAK